MERALSRLVKFAVAMFAMTIVCTVVWQESVTDRLYNCTDPAWLDFLRPGDWVHAHAGHPVVVVPKIVGGGMEDPDTIKEGWSVSKLWFLWYSFVAVSVVLSALLSWPRWIPNPQPNTTLEPTATAPSDSTKS
jgi:hypothetical protein